MKAGWNSISILSQVHPHANPLLIGQTNLQQLKISDQQGRIELGSDSARRLFLLKRDLPEKLTGSWTSEGLVAGEVVTFRLELPAATTTQFELLTNPGILVTSVGGLVLGPEPAASRSDTSTSDTSVPDADTLMKWTILPGDSAHLTFSCRAATPASVAGSDAPHIVQCFACAGCAGG